MKKFEFESNGAKWMLIEDEPGLRRGFPFDMFDHPIIINKITEKQASEVVGDMKFHDFGNYLPTYKLKLEALLKSKGIHLYKNPYRDDWDELCIWGHGCFAKNGKSSFELFTEAEAKTFYNPVLFKILP